MELRIQTSRVRFALIYWFAFAEMSEAFLPTATHGWIAPRTPSLSLGTTAMAVPSLSRNTTGDGFDIVSSTTHQEHAFAKPAEIEFVSVKEARLDIDDSEELFECNPDDAGACVYPFVNMLRGSARYIAEHRDQTAVFHIPGELLDNKHFDKLMDDLALSWLLGLKIVIVVGCRYDVECCSEGVTATPECENELRVTDDKLLRDIEEEAGYVRFEVERNLNRCLRLQGSLSPSNERNPVPNGNVVGGNFYTAKPFGVVHDTNFQNTGYPSHIHAEKIQQALENNDVLLLTTVGTSRRGACVNVNGNHLAAAVASALDAHKLVYFSSKGAVLRKTGEKSRTLQEMPLSFVKDFLDHHHVHVHRAGFANFEHANRNLSRDAVEMLLHLGWSSYALELGVNRAHIVNPGDGALLEELYTARHGINTCLYHDDEHDDLEDDDGVADDLKEALDAMLPANQDQILLSELPTIAQS